MVGTCVGVAVGSAVGSSVGVWVGACVGVAVGSALGSSAGAWLGAAVILVLHDGPIQPLLHAHLHEPSPPPHSLDKPLIIFCREECMLDSLHDTIQFARASMQPGAHP